MTATPFSAACGSRRMRQNAFLAALFISAFGSPSDALAQDQSQQSETQDATLVPGDGIVTQFSGFLDRERRNLDAGGVVARVMEIETGGPAPSEPEELTSLTAEDVGQVFAAEIAGADSPAIYLGASSAYGLYRNEDDSGWAAGMWGPEGGPGTIWKLLPGDDPQAFATIGGEDRENDGAGLGDLAYDEAHDRLIVSDLSSGMIHSLDPKSGEVLQTFDHGVDGRSYFLDAQTGEYLVLDVVPFDPRNDPEFEACRNSAGEAAPFASEPDCWGITDFRRRVWGLGVAEDPSGDATRLYYAVWGGAALGSDNWRDGTEDARTSIWSVQLDRNGNFDLTDVRREIVLPPFEEGDEETAPVVDMAFPDGETMILAERGRPAPDLQGDPASLIDPQKGRVLALRRNDEGVWSVDGRFDVGAPAGPTGIQANAVGGVALGARGGPTGDGAAIEPGGRLWMTVDPLCAPDAACEGIAGEDRAAGLQATRLGSSSSLARAEGEGVVVPRADDAVVLARNLPIGSIGQIAVYRGWEVELTVAEGPRVVPTTRPAEPEAEVAEPPLEPQPLPDEQAEVEPAAEAELEVETLADVVLGRSEADLAVTASAVEDCAPGTECAVEISISNEGSVDYDAPVLVTGTPGSSGVTTVSANGEGWDCTVSGGVAVCRNLPASLAPQAETSFTVTLRPSQAHGSTRLEYCGALTWLGRESRDRTRVVQAALRAEGFEPGSVDGLMGPNTAGAIRQAQEAAGLPADGAVTGPVIVELFGDGAFLEGDAADENDRACAVATVDLPPRPQPEPQPQAAPRVDRGPAHRQSLSAFHRDHQSRFHDSDTSTAVEMHETEMSRFHQTYGSGLHDSRTSRPEVRDRDGFHDTSSSRFSVPDGGGGDRLRVHEVGTSQTQSLHEVRRSEFHRQASSAVHDPRTSRGRLPDRDGPGNAPLQHDRLTSGVRPAY